MMLLSLALLLVAVSRIDALRSLPRVSTSGGVFLAGGKAWSPRGQNYIRLNGTQGPHTALPGFKEGLLPVYHSTFSPLFFNGTAISAAAADACGALGYNFFRVFIDEGTTTRGDGVNGDPNGAQVLNEVYMANVAEFVSRVSDHGCYTMITLGDVPQNAHFLSMRGNPPAYCEYPNCALLAPTFISTFAAYAGAFSADLASRLGGDTSALFTYSLANEGAFTDNNLPFSSSSITVSPADGGSYAMASALQRQACADNGTVFWVAACVTALRAVDPDTTITTGMFTNQAVGKSGFDGLVPVPNNPDPRHPFRPSDLSGRSGLDWLDVHVYPFGLVVAGDGRGSEVGPTWSLGADLATSEWSALNFTRTPVSMCETGSFKQFYATAEDAAGQLAVLQQLSCGYNFTGWGVWTWDTWEQDDFLWMAVDGGGAIAQSLSPIGRPNPCVA